jgi:hypothetical protein
MIEVEQILDILIKDLMKHVANQDEKNKIRFLNEVRTFINGTLGPKYERMNRNGS